jgi:flagellar protein FliO/FliZ
MDMIDAFRYLGALAIVLALVGAAGLALRRYGLPGIAGSGRRLTIVDSLMLGRNQRAIILRCDGIEHIVVTTREGATVIASAPAKPQAERAAA